jgi:hypothetical protein
MRVIAGMPIRVSGSFLLFLLALGFTSASAQNSVSRLHRLDQLSRAVQQGSGSASAVAESVITGARNADLAGISIHERLASAQSAYLSGAPEFAVTDFSVTAAFDAWRSVIGDPNKTPSSPLALHLYRGLLAHVASSLVSKDANGFPSRFLSPAEGLYLFDELTVLGGVPPIDSKAVKPDSKTYEAAVASYLASKTQQERQRDIAEIVSKYLLLSSD